MFVISYIDVPILFQKRIFFVSGSVTRCGELGAGNTTKLANQIIVAGNIQAVSEAFILAKKAGVNPECVFEAIKGGLAWQFRHRQPLFLTDLLYYLIRDVS